MGPAFTTDSWLQNYPVIMALCINSVSDTLLEIKGDAVLSVQWEAQFLSGK